MAFLKKPQPVVLQCRNGRQQDYLVVLDQVWVDSGKIRESGKLSKNGALQ